MCHRPTLPARVAQEREAAQMLDQLREITGVQDAELLSRALMDSRAAGGNYDVARAVALLVDGCQTAEQPAEPAAPAARAARG